MLPLKGFNILLVREKKHIESKVAKKCGKYLLHLKKMGKILETLV